MTNNNNISLITQTRITGGIPDRVRYSKRQLKKLNKFVREQNKSHTQNPTATVQSLLVLRYGCHSCYGISSKQKYPFADRFSFNIVLCYMSEDSWVPQ